MTDETKIVSLTGKPYTPPSEIVEVKPEATLPTPEIIEALSAGRPIDSVIMFLVYEDGAFSDYSSNIDPLRLMGILSTAQHSLIQNTYYREDITEDE